MAATATVKAGQPNVQKLMKPTKAWPKGRPVKLDEQGNVVGPKTNILGNVTKVIKNEYGVPIKNIKLPINGGHVKEEGSVWRIALRGPTRFEKKVTLEKEVYAATKAFENVAPQLELDESKEYQEYVKFLKETDKTIASDITNEEADATDKAFYKWLKGDKKTTKKEA